MKPPGPSPELEPSTFLCTHLASHGYAVAAMDHSEIVAPELMRKDGETFAERAARIPGWIDNRVPDVRCLLDRILGATGKTVGHRFQPRHRMPCTCHMRRPAFQRTP